MAAAAGFAGYMGADAFGGGTVDAARTLVRLRRLATLLDTALRLPRGFRVGADPIIGLAPGIGNALTTAMAAYIVFEAWRLGLPRSALLRMAANVAIDGAVGMIPVAGNIFDFIFRANIRNLAIIERHLAER